MLPIRRGDQMGSIIQCNEGGWLIDYGIGAGDDESRAADFLWGASSQIADFTAGASSVVGFDSSRMEASCKENPCLKKRNRTESCAEPGTKACREKLRRDRLNDRYSELSSILDPGRPPKSDKTAILLDATRRLKQLRLEAKMLSESNKELQESIKNLKEEKSELRDEKARLKLEKERAELALKGLISPPSSFLTYPAASAAGGAYHPAMYSPAFSKSSSYPAYPSVGMWQWLPPATLDTSQDHVLRPPVA